MKPGDRIYNGAVDFAYAIVGKGINALNEIPTLMLFKLKSTYEIGMNG